MITFTKNGGTKILSKESGLIKILLADGWEAQAIKEPKKEAKKEAKKEVKNVKSSTTNSK